MIAVPPVIPLIAASLARIPLTSLTLLPAMLVFLDVPIAALLTTALFVRTLSRLRPTRAASHVVQAALNVVRMVAVPNARTLQPT